MTMLNLSENEMPKSGDLKDFYDVTEETPRSGSEGLYVAVPGTHDQETRKKIALIILTMVGVFYAAILWTFLAGWIETDKFTAAIAGVSGIQALAAAAIGFYYGSKQD
jgi:uncharacterized membrane protein